MEDKYVSLYLLLISRRLGSPSVLTHPQQSETLYSKADVPFSRNSTSLLFDSRKLHPSKAIQFFLEINVLVPLSSSRFNFSRFDPSGFGERATPLSI